MGRSASGDSVEGRRKTRTVHENTALSFIEEFYSRGLRVERRSDRREEEEKPQQYGAVNARRTQNLRVCLKFSPPAERHSFAATTESTGCHCAKTGLVDECGGQSQAWAAIGSRTRAGQSLDFLLH